MILPVSNLQTKNLINRISQQNNKHNYISQSADSNQTSARFNKSQSGIVFKGGINDYDGPVYDYDGTVMEIDSDWRVKYKEELIADAKKFMHESNSWKEKLYESKLAYYRKCFSTPSDLCERFVNGIFSLGISEALHNSDLKNDAKNHVKRVAVLIEHLQNAEREQTFKANAAREADLAATRSRLAADAVASDARNRAAIEKVEYTNKLNDLHSQLKTDFCDKVNMERHGSYIEKIPNAIMIEDPYDDVSKELVDYTRRNSESRFIRLDSSDNNTLMDNLEETLKGSKAHFDSTKERTLIHVERFDRLITRGQNSFENIESLKDIMCRCAKDFGSTIIFRTQNASKIVSEAIQSQRVAVRILANFRSVR